MKLRQLTRGSLALSIALLAVFGLVAGAGTQPSSASRWVVHDLRRSEARALASGVPAAARSTRAAAWCGTARQTDHVPNVVAGNPVHWIYAIPSDGPDAFSTWSNAMQADAESIDAWWRASDPTRTLRNDLAQFSCGQQVDISMIRLSQSSGQLASVDTRFESIAGALIALYQFSSNFTKYVVYYDGPVEPEICGQGGSLRAGLGFAVVYTRACAGVPLNTTVAHEVLHTIGAVAAGAPHMCPEPDDGHVCDDPHDMMYPFGDETPITGLTLDTGRDDYYGHSGSWPDTQDSPWLVRLDRQASLTVAITGPGSVAADVPGLLCAQTCTTTWSADTALALAARPAAGAKLVRWGGACSGSEACRLVVGRALQVSALFAPSTYRLTVAVGGRGSVRSSSGGLVCPPRCSSLVPSYASLRLSASPAKGWRFKSWAGACRGTRTACTLPMTAAASTRAVFVRR